MNQGRFAPAVRAVFLSVLIFGNALAPAAAAALEVDLDSLKGFSASATDKVGQARALMAQVLSSEQFKQAILAFTYGGKTQFSNNELADAQGDQVAHDMTNQQVYDTLMASRETYLNNADQTAHLDLTLYTPPFWKKWSVVGYGYPGQPQIFMNRYYFNSYTLAQVAANLAHEWTHKLGFDHDYNRTARRPYSVPYGVGCLVEHLGAGTSTASCSQ